MSADIIQSDVQYANETRDYAHISSHLHVLIAQISFELGSLH